MNRIDERFEMLRREGRKAFIPYICAGDPSLEATKDIFFALEEAGADVIELGVPFSDPLADGAVIQAADIRSLANGFKIDGLFETIIEIRKKSSLPIAVMVYYSSILGYGSEEFVEKCDMAGADALIIPDLPYEEYDEIEEYMAKSNLYMVPLVAITSQERLPMLLKGAKGFVYCVSSIGVTGERTGFDARVDDFIKEAKTYTDTPCCIGFGISTRENVERFEKIADGVIVGSAIVKNIFENNADTEELKKFVKNLRG